MRAEAASAGLYRSPYTGKDYAKSQSLTLGELLDGKRLGMPALRQSGQTFTRAPKSKPKKTHRQKLIGEDEG